MITNYWTDTKIEDIKAPWTYSVGDSRVMSCGCSSSGSKCKYHEGFAEWYEQGIQVGVIDEVDKQYGRGMQHGVLLTLFIVSLAVLLFTVWW